MYRRKNKKAALELSISTIVVLVLGMTMLILGITLVTNILRGATGTVDLIDKNVKSQINKLFNDEDTRSVVYLADNQADVEKGVSYNIGFGIKNVIRGGTGEQQGFTYRVEAAEVESGCALTLAEADSYIRLGKELTRPILISPGEDPKERIIVVEPSEGAPLCLITYDITVFKGTLGSEVYDTNFFVLKIVG